MTSLCLKNIWILLKVIQLGQTICLIDAVWDNSTWAWGSTWVVCRVSGYRVVLWENMGAPGSSWKPDTRDSLIWYLFSWMKKFWRFNTFIPQFGNSGYKNWNKLTFTTFIRQRQPLCLPCCPVASGPHSLDQHFSFHYFPCLQFVSFTTLHLLLKCKLQVKLFVAPGRDRWTLGSRATAPSLCRVTEIAPMKYTV